MIKLLYKLVNVIASMLGGLLAGLIFKRVWKVIGRGDDAPKPTDERPGWGRSCWPPRYRARFSPWSRPPLIAALPRRRASS